MPPNRELCVDNASIGFVFSVEKLRQLLSSLSDTSHDGEAAQDALRTKLVAEKRSDEIIQRFRRCLSSVFLDDNDDDECLSSSAR